MAFGAASHVVWSIFAKTGADAMGTGIDTGVGTVVGVPAGTAVGTAESVVEAAEGVKALAVTLIPEL